MAKTASFLNLRDADDIVISCPQPFRASDVCLACLHADGRLALLTGAWESVLGYTHAELDGRNLYSLLAYGRDDARQVVRHLLDAQDPDPLRLDVIVKGGHTRTLGVHRRFDPYEPALYLACEPFDEKGAEISFASRILSFRSSP